MVQKNGSGHHLPLARWPGLVFAAWLTGITGYLGVITASAWWASQRRRATDVAQTHSPSRHFCFVVPAHNEERSLGDTLKRIAESEYPDALVDVHVVADHCTDMTADVALTHGAHVHVPPADTQQGKGPALTWLLDRLALTGQLGDAVVVVDADTLVASDFLHHMDGMLAEGHRAVQGYYTVRSEDSSWPVAMRSAALALRHYVRPLGRTTLGGSAGLRGNAMVFASDLIRGRRWSGHLTEDLEFEAQLLLDGERVAFCPEAVVQAEMPERLRDAATQNSRWEAGRARMARHYVPRLLSAALRGSSRERVACADAAIDHLVPPLSLVGMASAGSVVLAVLMTRRGDRGTARSATLTAGTSVFALVGHVFVGLRIAGARPAVWRALWLSPIYAVWKLSVWSRAVRPGAVTTWTRTRRNSEVSECG